MDELQSHLRPFLRAHGYRIHARKCNRTTADGLIHVIRFQMGRFDPPGTNYIPWFREKVYGKFTVNVGVYVPEVYAEWFRWSKKGAPTFVDEADCCVRVRLGQLGPERSDIWWKIEASARIASQLQSRIESDALPFLARFETRDGLLKEFSAAGGECLLGGRTKTVCAIMLAARGNAVEARQLLREHAQQAHDLKQSEYAHELARRLGLGPRDA